VLTASLFAGDIVTDLGLEGLWVFTQGIVYRLFTDI